VPFFVLDRRYGVSGAQPPEALLQALQRAWDEAVSVSA
jgi:predicted DsbA family dithiol-disulfide isomerase